MNPLRIALVHPFSWPEVRRGGERYLADLAWYLDRAGHRVDLITGTSGRSGRSTEGRVRVRRLHHIKNAAVHKAFSDEEIFGFRCYPHLVAHRFDVVHAFVPSAALAARSAGRRTIYTVLGHPSAELVAALPRQRRLMGLAVRTATVAVALSRASADASESAFDRPTQVLSPGVILDRFPLAPDPRAGPPSILFNAFASNPEKGLGTLLDAFALLRERVTDARLVLAGPG
ncbi:MAG: glycosyltransferase family 4 protein, partial [Actinomycetota bacterium]